MFDLKNFVAAISESHKTLYILCGFPYAGKSYLVSELRTRADVEVVSIDDIFHSHGFDWDTNALPDTKMWGQIFNESYAQAKDALVQGKNVLYDSTNHTVASRDTLRQVAQSVGADSKVVYVKSPIETVWKRWEENQKNQTRSVVSKELVQKTIDMFEEPTEKEDLIVIGNQDD